MDTVAVRGAQNIRPRGVHGVVDHVGGCVQQPVFSSIDDFSFVVDLDQVAGFDQAEGQTEWVHPEGGGVDRVTESDVPGDAFVIAEFAEDAEGKGKAAFEVFSFLVLVGEGGWRGEFHHLRGGGLAVHFWFVGSCARGLGGGAVEPLGRSGL